jgi:hypothetical protein
MVVHSSADQTLAADAPATGQVEDGDAPAATGQAATKFDPLEGVRAALVLHVLPGMLTHDLLQACVLYCLACTS